jgi:hypothetical protein
VRKRNAPSFTTDQNFGSWAGARPPVPIELGDVTYTPKPDQAYEAHSCAEC